MNAVPERFAGVALALGSIFVIDLNQITPVHQLWLPLLLAAGAYLMTQSLMAVAIASGTLAYIHINTASPFWVDSIAYPIIVFVSGAIIAITLIKRFRQRIAATHEARWARRQSVNKDNS
jgi:predicted membrane protein